MVIDQKEVAVAPAMRGSERGSEEEAKEPWAQALLNSESHLFIPSGNFKYAALAVAQFRLRHNLQYGIGVTPLTADQDIMGFTAPEDGLLVIRS